MSVVASQRRGQPIRLQADEKGKENSPEAYGVTYYPGTLDPARAAIIEVGPGADLRDINVGLLPTKTVRVSGRISVADGDLPPAILIALAPITGGHSLDTQSRSDGSFEFAEVPPGKYSLAAVGLLQQGNQLTANQQLEIAESDLEGVHLMLGRAQNLKGAVVLPPGRKLPSGLVIVLGPREQSRPFASQSGGFAQLTENGVFSIEGVQPGDYDLLVGSAGKGGDLYVSAMRSGNQDVLASGLHIGASTPPPVEITLSANGAEVDCSVVNEKQKPAPEAHVVLLPDPPRRSQLALHAQCQADASGKCVLLGVAPGDYLAFAYDSAEPIDYRDPETMARLEKSGKAVAVKQGDRVSVKLVSVDLDEQEN